MLRRIGRSWFEAWVVVLELSKRHCRNTDNETAKHSLIGIGGQAAKRQSGDIPGVRSCFPRVDLNRNHMPDTSVIFKALRTFVRTEGII